MEKRTTQRVATAIVLLGLVFAAGQACTSKSSIHAVPRSGEAGEAGAPGTEGSGGTGGSDAPGPGSAGAAGSDDEEECSKGEIGCTDNVPARCTEQGKWESARGPCAVACLSGECVDCIDGDLECRDGAVVECQNGRWETSDSCAVTCEVDASAGARCVDSCTKDRLQCSGNQLQICDGTQYVDQEECEFLCLDDACSGECVPDAHDCQNATPRVCSSNGSWQDQPTCSGQTPVCDASTARCVQCLTDEHCGSGTPVCDGNNECVECETDQDCSDPTPVCDSGSNTCVACGEQACVAPPAGWQGPVVLLTGTEQSPPMCPGSAPVTSFEALSGLDAPSATCDCSCQTVPSSDQSCGDVDIGLSSAPCTPTPTMQVTTASRDDCNEFVGNLLPSGNFMYLSITPSEWSASTGCTPQPTVNKPAVTWDNAYVACDLPSSCQANGKCVEGLGTGQQLCVYVSGNAQCPTDFPNPIDTWVGATDTRDCSACSCGDPTGTCSGTVTFSEVDCLPFRTQLADLSLASCTSSPSLAALDGVASTGLSGNFAPSGGSCTPSTSTPQGTVTPTGERTVCCQ